MPERRAAGEPAPPRTDRPLRQVVVYLAITYAIALGIAPLISICPVSLSHSAFNNLMETGARAATATSPAMMAYVTTETGVATMVIVALVAAFLLTRRAADFDRAKPEGALPTAVPHAGAQRARPSGSR